MDILTMIMACSLYRDNAITHAMVQIGSDSKPLAVTSIAPDGQQTTKSDFADPAKAAEYARAKFNEGNEIRVGLMQISSRWLAPYLNRNQARFEDLFRSCKNMVIATDVLNKATRTCHKEGNYRPSCALSIYISGNKKDGIDYAKTVLTYAKQNPLKVKEALPQHIGTPKQPPKIPKPSFTKNVD